MVCPAKVVHLPRHLKDIHQFTHVKAIHCIKNNRDRVSTTTSGRRYRKCPLCVSSVLYLPKHLRSVHKYTPHKAREISKKTKCTQLQSNRNERKKIDYKVASCETYIIRDVGKRKY